MSHDDDTCPHLVVLGRLEAENARLKAEIEMMKASSRGHSTSHLYQRMAEENARLKAEVDAVRKYWKATGEGVNRYVGKSIALEDEIARLKAEVELLTKAGDELERVLTSKMSSYEVGNASFQWRAAKEGKPRA